MSFRLGQVANGDKLALPPGEGPLAAARTTILGLVENGHLKVLVVGGKGDNFPTEMREHPQLVFWDQPRDRAPELPQSVRLVLTTRFLNHPFYESVKAQCKASEVQMVMHPLGTGQIRDLLEPFLLRARKRSENAATSPVVETTPAVRQEKGTAPVKAELKRFAFGGLKEFVAANANIDAVPRTAEADRVVALAESRGYYTTPGSVIATMGQLRDERHSDVAVEVRETAPAKAPVVPVAPAQPQVDDEDAQLLKMMDDVIAAVGLMRETLIKRSEDVRRMREIRDMLGKMKL